MEIKFKKYLKALHFAASELVYSPFTIIAVSLLFTLQSFFSQIIAFFPNALVVGLLLAILWIFVLTYFYELLDVGRSWRPRWKKFLSFRTDRFLLFINTYFIFWIGHLLFKSLLQSAAHSSPEFVFYLNLIILLVFNSLPETIVEKEIGGLEAFSESASIFFNRTFSWLLPVLLVQTLPVLLLTGFNLSSLSAIVFSDPLLPGAVYFQFVDVNNLITWLPSILIASILAIFLANFRFELYRTSFK
ncbi:MAG TPA: hypothetical protein PKD37_00255 [Oligoflexia bacterium]|nr:hypothetical protein [Oligoflexia bacterium]HMP26412.1 hypothetical protein [Oligoflexia bacterium]